MAQHPAAHVKDIPFRELLAPFVAAARAEFLGEAGSAARLLDAGSAPVLEEALERYLAGFALPTLYQELALFRALQGQLPWVTGPHSTDVYSEFRAGWSGELLSREYPELPELLRSWASGWARSHARLARRVEADWPVISRRFLAAAGRQPELGAVLPYCSDPHEGGQTVAIISAASNGAGPAAVVYKPRSLHMEAWFYELLAWINDRGFSCPFRIPTIEPRPGYGWMEFIPSTACPTAAGVEAFYRRAGGLLALAALVQGTDLHRENLIAHGDQPVLVDLETLLHPRADASGLHLADTLADTGLLPRAGGPDFSAFGPGEALETPYPALACSAPNTDAMSLEYSAYRAPARGNAPMLCGRPQPAPSYAWTIADGFREMYDLLVDHRQELGGTGGLLQSGGALTGRRVIRSSNIYGLVMQRSLEPCHMRTPGGRRRFLARALPHACEGEIEALESMNVPYLTGSCRGAAGQAAKRLSGLARNDWRPCVEAIHAALARAGPEAAPAAAAARAATRYTT